MPGPKFYFPSRENRRKLLEELQKLRGQNAISAMQEYQQYLTALQALDALMEACSANGDDGLPKPLTSENKDALLAHMVQVAEAGEHFIVKAGLDKVEKKPGNQPQQNALPPEPAQANDGGASILAPIVDRMQSILSRDFNTIKDYDPKKQRSLPELQADARTRTIDLRDRKLGKLGGLQSSRITMTLVNAKGEKRRGVFTRAKYVRTKQRFTEMLKRVMDRCTGDDERDAVEAFFPAYRASLAGQNRLNNGVFDGNTSDEAFIGQLLRDAGDYSEEKHGDAGKLSAKDLPGLFPFFDFRSISPEVQKELARGIRRMARNVSNVINSQSLELKDGDRLDNRNSAMSAVASLLGVPELLAKSENMKVINDDGSVTEGTFMDFANGVDLSEKPELFRHVDTNPFRDPTTRCKVFRQIADLQVLDILCMNRDRHCGNIIYDLDRNGQICGIQGIDNDSSFARGEYKALNYNAIKVLSKSMADTLTKLDPAMLKMALRGHGLSQEELDYAGRRLTTIQQRISENKIPIVEDNQFGRVKLSWLCSKKNAPTNLFSKLKTFLVDEAEEYRRRYGIMQPTSLPDHPDPDFKEVGTTDRHGTLGGLKDSLAKVGRLVANDETNFRVGSLSSIFRGSSPEFDEMVRVAKQTAALQRQFRANANLSDGKLLFEDEHSVKAFRTVDESYQKLEAAARSYLEHKAGDTPIEEIRGKNDYEQARIDYARNILKAVDQYRENFAPDTPEEEDNVQENITRRRIEQTREKNADQNQPKQSAQGPNLQ